MRDRKIDATHKLPCDFVVGRTRFKVGVELETVRQAAERWWAAATKELPMNAGLTEKDREEMIQKITTQ